MKDEQARRAIGEALARLFAARGDTPDDMAALLGRIDAPPPPAPRARKPFWRK